MSQNLPPDSKKPFQKLTKGDLAESIRFGQWFSNLWSTSVAEYMGCSIKRIFSLKKAYTGIYYRNIICLSLSDFLTKNNFIIHDEYSINHDDFSSSKKEEIEIAKGKFKEVTIEGFLFLEKAGHKFVLGLEDGYRNNEWVISINYNRDAGSSIKSFLVDLETFARSKCYLNKAKIDPSLSFIKLNKEYSWNDIILPKYIKDEIKLNTEKLVNSIDFYKKHNLPFKRGVILEGIPGIGKTLIGRILCSTVDCSFLWVTPKFLETAQSISIICELARQISPCILFLEDLDLYASDRSTNRDSNFLGELMNQLDGLVENNYVIVVATTNKVDFIEDAIRNRPGRFDRTIEIPLPTTKGREKLLKLCLLKFNIDTDNLDYLHEVAEKSKDFTGSHIQELVNTAVMVAIDVGSLDKDKNVILRKEFLFDNIEKVKNKILQPQLGFDSDPPLNNKKPKAAWEESWDEDYD